MIYPDEETLLPARKVLQRYGIADRTLDRWLAVPSNNFPSPIVINRRRYFRVSELQAWEQQRTRAVSVVS